MRGWQAGWRAGLVWLGCAALVGAAENAPQSALAPPTAEGLKFFEERIRPVLVERCYECHSTGAKIVKGELLLDSRGGVLKGGETGPAVVPGNLDESLVLQALAWTGDFYDMPPSGKLPDSVLADFRRWVEMGAPDPRDAPPAAAPAKREINLEAGRRHWSFQPLAPVAPPPVKDAAWPQTPVDRFILARLEAEGLRPNPLVDRQRLIRRVYLDVVGMPPTPEEIDRFVADPDPRAYERLVDRLLADPRFGERWARHWLDLARFAESHGYEQDYDRPFAYAYRDFVIRAFNDDLPFDTFVAWQLAGDRLAPDNPEAWKATGFLAAGTHATQITANQAEKERYDELDDIVNTIGTSMLGLTIGCARCHDHKFDPIPSQDYYRLVSTFTTTVRSNYDVEIDAAETRRQRAAWEAAHAPKAAALAKFEQGPLRERFEKWLASRPALPETEWLALKAEKVSASGAYYTIVSFERQPDGSYLSSSVASPPNAYTFVARVPLEKVGALRLDVLPDDSLPSRGPGWHEDGGFTLKQVEVTATPIDPAAGKAKLPAGGKLKLSAARATFEEPKFPAASVVSSGAGWRTSSRPGQRQSLVLDLAEPLEVPGGVVLSVVLRFSEEQLRRHDLGRFRVSVSPGGTPPSLDGPVLPQEDYLLARETLAADAKARRPEGLDALRRVFAATDAEWRKLAADVDAHLQAQPHAKRQKVLVSSEGLPAIRLHTQGPDFYEKSYYLKRGDPNQKQGEATPGFLQVLSRPQGDAPSAATPPSAADTAAANPRVRLAEWITDRDQGAGNLLARVMVNRLWQHHLGRGLVATPSDFGATGAKPSHPELLDYLAGELVRGDWRLKPLHRLILLSAVYRQTTAIDEARARHDPENALCWRANRTRLDAEAIRDSILFVSGRLDPRMYGPGTLDEAMRRRSIYFTVKRSKLIPMMVQFDWPDSLQGVGRRVNTTVAPQALLLMNNPQVRAAAGDLARLVAPSASTPPDEAVVAVYRRALGRRPSAEELADAVEFLRAQAATYPGQDASHLALTDFCQAVFSLNEFIYPE